MRPRTCMKGHCGKVGRKLVLWSIWILNARYNVETPWIVNAIERRWYHRKTRQDMAPPVRGLGCQRICPCGPAARPQRSTPEVRLLPAASSRCLSKARVRGSP